MGKWKMNILGRAERDNSGGFVFQTILPLTRPQVITHPLGVGLERDLEQMEVPVLTNLGFGRGCWLYRNTVVRVDSSIPQTRMRNYYSELNIGTSTGKSPIEDQSRGGCFPKRRACSLRAT